MILVFGSFIFGGLVVIKMFGIGLAAAVLMDALIVRMVLVPGLMLTVGKANWWLPGFLDRILPRLNVEGSVEPEVHVAPGHAGAPAGPPRPVTQTTGSGR